MTAARDLPTRSDVESFAARCLASLHGGRFWHGHGLGASDAAFGRPYGYSRGSATCRQDYAFGYYFGRFVLFAGLPRWQAPLTPAEAATWRDRFAGSTEGRTFASLYPNA